MPGRPATPLCAPWRWRSAPAQPPWRGQERAVLRAERDTTPSEYVETLRLEVARRFHERANDPMEHVVRSCDFGSPRR